jgi:hypothetical protein
MTRRQRRQSFEYLSHAEHRRTLRRACGDRLRCQLQQPHAFLGLRRAGAACHQQQTRQVAVEQILVLSEKFVDESAALGVADEGPQKVGRALSPPSCPAPVEEGAGQPALVAVSPAKSAATTQRIAQSLVKQAEYRSLVARDGLYQEVRR